MEPPSPKPPWERVIAFRGDKETWEALEELVRAQPYPRSRSSIVKQAIREASKRQSK